MKKKLKQRVRTTLMSVMILLIISFVLIYFMGNKIEGKKEFMKNASKVEATIIDIKYESVIEEDEIEEVDVRYIVNNRVYIGSLQEKSSTMYIGKKIDIYYDINNPSCFIQNNQITDNIVYYIGWVTLALGIFMILDTGHKVYIYLYTSNGRKIKAKIEEVIEKENCVGKMYNKVVDFASDIYHDVKKVEKVNYKSYKIKCSWTDKDGTQYIFYSKKFHQPCFVKEFEKMDLKELTVRFKNKRKYIVLTEEIEKRLKF